MIRRHENIVLVGGSGFGDAEGTLPYLTGDWSLQFNYPPMPLDGLLLGSRVMVAKEGCASDSIKELIVKAPGIEDESLWETSYKKPIGGIVTVVSELGEPIHKIATRGVMLWKEMDETVFKFTKEKRIKVLQEKKNYIIERLNKDFQKVWFGRKSDGTVCDLNEMTYSEVTYRLAELLYISKLSRWIDPSYMSIVYDYLKRLEERFLSRAIPTRISNPECLQNPKTFIPQFLSHFPEAEKQLLTSEDVYYFISICQQRGRKPVTFIPVLDENFSIWFKKDSLWQSEFIEAVVDEDPERVCVLHGPVAARHSTIVNEPVKDILDNIYHGLEAKIMARYYNGDSTMIPSQEFFGGLQIRYTGEILRGVSAVSGDKMKLFHLPLTKQDVPSIDEWLQLLSGPSYNWVRALLTSSTFFQAHRFVDNPMKMIFRPRIGQTVRIIFGDNEQIKSISIFDQTLIKSTHKFLEMEPNVVAEFSNNKISVSLNERRQNQVIPLRLYFNYVPQTGYATIHEIMDGRNDRIKEFYGRLWFNQTEMENLHQLMKNADANTRFKSTHKVTRQQISQFCEVIGNHSELYVQTRQSRLVAPMDFAIVVAWKALISTLFMKFVDGDLLKLVHLSNQFNVLNGSRLIREGDVCETVSEILCVKNSDTGKQIDVKAVVTCGNEPVCEIISSFFIRGNFSDYPYTFQKIDETPMQIAFKTTKDVEILKSKSWFKCLPNQVHNLKPGCSLTFRLHSYFEYNDSKSFSLIRTTGTVEIQTTTEDVVHIGDVKYENSSSVQYGNPVTAYLERAGTPIEQPIPLVNDGYKINTAEGEGSSVQAPSSNGAYSQVSGDCNPIHVNPYFADYASLPGTITHGMWTSAATRKFVEIFAADNQPQRVISYSANFMAMVLPSDILETKLYHVGMKNGLKLIRVEVVNQNGVIVVNGNASVEQPPTAYVFTGQGSQEVGMGMGLYGSSPVAKSIWDRADNHFKTNYGFSILEIVQVNPNSKTIHFGGKTGQHIKKNYMNMKCDVVDSITKETKTIPLFPEITPETTAYTFKAHTGLLSATQFTQPALTLVELAAFEDMRSKGLVSESCLFAGHSLGEYAALAAVANVFPVETLADVVFYRGMTMQHAVPRDSENRSCFGMIAVNPSRVSPTFDEHALSFVIKHVLAYALENHTIEKPVLEIVNYNVENWQYVLAGDLFSLDATANVLNAIKVMKIDIKELQATVSLDIVEENMKEMVSESFKITLVKEKEQGRVILERGYATIPLPGIDVPFHSSFLLPGVGPFRNFLTSKLEACTYDLGDLVQKYVPNLTAKPFEVSIEYLQCTYERTQSHKVLSLLEFMKKTPICSSEEKLQIGQSLMIELLAYQFASPVRWIETQDVLFREFKVERLIEIGPSPTLVGMANRTLKLKYTDFDDALTYRRSNLCYSKDTKEIYYQWEDEIPAEQTSPAEQITPDVPVVSVSAPATTPVPLSSGPAAPISDEPISATEILHVVVAQKVKKPVGEIPLSKSIKDISGGKSTLQNEILGDLQKEFGSAGLPEKGEELPLEELGTTLSAGASGSLGKHTSTLVAKLISSKMPGGFNASAVKGYLSSRYGLGPQRCDGLLLLATTMEPASRLASESEAKTYLDSVAKAYATKQGIQFTAPTSAGAGAGGSVVAINSEEFNQLVAKQHVLLRTQLEAFSKFLENDLYTADRSLISEKDNVIKLQEQLDHWLAEHGEIYADGIHPKFSASKARRFDSYWNWVRCDALNLYYDIIFGRTKEVDRGLVVKCVHVMNRSNPTLLDMMKYWIQSTSEQDHENAKLLKQLGQELMNNCESVMNSPPVYKLVDYLTAPQTTVKSDGQFSYQEVPREGVRNVSAYVQDMANGSSLMKVPSKNAALQSLEALYQKVSKKEAEVQQLYRDLAQFISQQDKNAKDDSPTETIPFLHLKRRSVADPTAWEYDSNLTKEYLNCLSSIAESGVSLAGKAVLLTGCGKESIGSEILKGLLSAGAMVVVTTSSFRKDVTEYYREIYENYGSKGSCLVVVPFNQGSKSDLENLIDYICGSGNGSLGWDLDFVIPFAAISENGREITDIDSKSELAHRIMLTNVIRLLGLISSKKKQLGQNSRPAQVILPLSPNHGTFGGDGLYGESKISLETLLNRWYSESWGQYLSICGAVIGWTRGTGLMSANNVISEGVEKLGVRTFSTVEMAFNIIGLMHPSLATVAQSETLWVDLAGAMNYIPNLNSVVKSLRSDIIESAEVLRAVTVDTKTDEAVVHGNVARKQEANLVTPRANMKLEFPKLKSYDELKKLSNMRGMVDLDKVVVITGYGEVGPWGNARTRWQMEAHGEFSLEGCIEMAWMMGMIKFHRGALKNGQMYSGWVDTESGEPVQDVDVKTKYEKRILEHTGIRLIEPQLVDGYDPNHKTLMQEVVVDHDLEAIEVSKAEADAFKLQHKDNVDVFELPDGQYSVRLRKGATLFVPKALRFDRLVAGLIPSGWDPARYGIPKDIVDQLDRISLFVLVSTVEAFVNSGITDPYEFYEYIHVTEIGNTSGTGVGGMSSQRSMFKDRYVDKPVQHDILQETFGNTMSAWVNLLLLSSSGTIKSCIGACATAVMSLDIGYETIVAGKAKVVIVGGYDDFGEEGSNEFANMKATSDSLEEFKCGREPREMSRPCTSTRGGFMEAQGSGMEVIMSATTAIKMGVPIYAIVALTNMATDKCGRSVPAPGQGILTTARETASRFNSPLLKLSYRRKQIERQISHIKSWYENEMCNLREEANEMKPTLTEAELEMFINERTGVIENEVQQQESAARNKWGNEFYKHHEGIAPIRGALSVWGLTVDDISVSSFHGTGTKANDVNESDVLNKQFAHLGRTPGNVCVGIFQKYLTGHPKGAAAAWMLNGILQVMQSGLIPGNRNADNIDEKLKKFEYILYPSRSIQTTGVKAALLKSFGFGQVGGEALVIHPDYLFTALTQSEYVAYKVKRDARESKAYRYVHDSMSGTADFVRLKSEAPYTTQDESLVYLNPRARAKYDPKINSWKFDMSKPIDKPVPQITNVVKQLVQNSSPMERGVGVDVELIDNINVENETFIERNFTPAEIQYCQNKPDPQASFAGKWAAKEAVIKSISSFNVNHEKVWTKGDAAPLNEIEINIGKSGAPEVILHGDAKKAASTIGFEKLKVSISHSDRYAVAVCHAI